MLKSCILSMKPKAEITLWYFSFWAIISRKVLMGLNPIGYLRSKASQMIFKKVGERILSLPKFAWFSYGCYFTFDHYFPLMVFPTFIIFDFTCFGTFPYISLQLVTVFLCTQDLYKTFFPKVCWSFCFFHLQ